MKISFINFCFYLICVFPLHTFCQSKKLIGSQEKINLAGKWSFQIDSSDVGISQHWYKKRLVDQVTLPGSMASNNKGYEITVTTPWTGSIFDSSWFTKKEYAKYRQHNNIKVPFWLQPVKYYKGAAWYQKTINVPASWMDKHIELVIERSHWETTVWIDDKLAGMQNSLSTAQVFNLSDVIKTGPHKLTVRIDNRIKDINVGVNSHSISDHTQTNWNGMIGRLSVVARPSVYINRIQLFPDIHRKEVRVKVWVENSLGRQIKAVAELLALAGNSEAERLKVQKRELDIPANGSSFETSYPMGKSPLLWDEFHPSLYKMKVSINSSAGKEDTAVLFGMREINSSGTQFTINGRKTFLRGTLECAIFPKTGYPPTDVQSWMRIFKVVRSYGLNHVRFHSWCPPDAAFEAADKTGIYLQIECASWANQGAEIGSGTHLDKYIYDESERIVNSYGNHPSFCMLAYGNEPAGKNYIRYLTKFVEYWKQKDTRRQYTTAAGWPTISESDYNSTPDPRIQAWGQGLKSIINKENPSTNYDWSKSIEKYKQPTVSHEIGQWCVYPDFKEIKKYTGVVRAKNFEIFKEKLESNGLGKYADSFLLASGKLQTLCYKADIEAALRTPGFAGFQLLDLHDFPGQGTALVGVLNPFWEANKQAFADAILRERSWELYFEGFRRVDLMRFGKWNEYLQAAGKTPNPAGANGYLPIPQYALNASKGGLTQTAGY